MMPMAFADLRLQVDRLVTASDASELGGGLCASTCLTDEGRRTLEALQSCCALARLECQIVGYASCEVDKECKRLVRKRWPGVIEEAINEKIIGDLIHSIGFEVDLLLITAGSPCHDLTPLLANRKGLAGARSKLYYEIPRIRKACVRRFPRKVALMVENVESMTIENGGEFSRVLACLPVLAMASDLSWVRQPRLYWLSWEIMHQGDETVIGNFPTFGYPGHWVEEGWCHRGSEALPTFTRALPRQKPPLQPAGIAAATSAKIQRWKEDGHQFQVYQYGDKHVLWRGQEWRPASLEEREKLMGFDAGYISNALPEKWSAYEKFKVGCCIIGNAFHVLSVMMLFHELLRSINGIMKPRNLGGMMKQARVAPPGWTAAPCFARDTVYDPQSQDLVHEILRQGDRAGTDIRLDVGIPFRIKAFPSAGLRTNYFSWRIIHGYKWKHTSHINSLELQAVTNSTQWRLRKLSNYRKRVLHLIDSQVVACVVAKGRTSSFRLRKGLHKLNPLLITAGLKLCAAYCHTSENPADIPSRWAEPKRAKQPGSKRGETSI